jgi:hypothetical protein
MPQKTLLITDFFSKCRSTTVSNSALFEKPTKVIKAEEQAEVKYELPHQCITNLPPEKDSTGKNQFNSICSIISLSIYFIINRKYQFDQTRRHCLK